MAEKDDFSQERIDKLLGKAYLKDEQETSERKTRPKEHRDDETFKVLATKRDENDLTKVLAFNKLVRESNVINHFVLDEKLGDFVCAGITFPDGHYEHLDEEVDQELVLMSTVSSETSTTP